MEELAARRVRLAFALLLALAFAQRAWNAYAVPPLTGYDAPGHAGYMLTILETGQLPLPFDGWSTFHPPLYHLVGSAVWGMLEPLGARTLVAGIRWIGSVAGLFVAVAAFQILLRLGATPIVAWMATALLLFVPVSQLTAAMIGNEGMAAALVSLALLPILALQRDPRSRRAAVAAGLLCGLALCVKYTAVYVLAAAAVPFLRRSFDRRAALTGLLLFGVVFAVAAPVYVRNVQLSGSPIPVTRDREPMKSAEAAMTLRERRVADFFWVPAAALLRPSVYHEPEKLGSYHNRNMAMTSVWGMTYATLWFDPFGHRTSVREHRDGVWHGPALTLLGLLPTLAMLAGFVLCWIEFVRRRGSTPDAPLVVLATVGLVAFTAIAIAAPSPAALKGSYLLGMSIPAAWFFARAATALGARLRSGLLAASGAASLLAGLFFTSGVFYPALPMGVRVWTQIGRTLPDSYILEAMQRMLDGWY